MQKGETGGEEVRSSGSYRHQIMPDGTRETQPLVYDVQPSSTVGGACVGGACVGVHKWGMHVWGVHVWGVHVWGVHVWGVHVCVCVCTYAREY